MCDLANLCSNYPICRTFLLSDYVERVLVQGIGNIVCRGFFPSDFPLVSSEKLGKNLVVRIGRHCTQRVHSLARDMMSAQVLLNAARARGLTELL